MQAVLFGGTGLTGSCILDLLNNDPDFKSIIVVTRNIFTHSSNKISNKVIDFSDPAEIESCIKQDSIVGLAIIFITMLDMFVWVIYSYFALFSAS